jgi:hypothetical protein
MELLYLKAALGRKPIPSMIAVAGRTLGEKPGLSQSHVLMNPVLP